MAPAIDVEGIFAKRYYCTDASGNATSCNNYSTWDNWGRWAAAAVVVVIILILAFGFSCFNSRRRRRMGQQPMYGTGWLGGNKYGQNGGNYYHNGPYNGAPAPPYTPAVGHQQTGNTFNSNEGYYGAPGYNHGYNEQQNGIELQSPQSAYVPQRGGDPVYEAPQGPPPKKGDGIIR